MASTGPVQLAVNPVLKRAEFSSLLLYEGLAFQCDIHPRPDSACSKIKMGLYYVLTCSAGFFCENNIWDCWYCSALFRCMASDLCNKSKTDPLSRLPRQLKWCETRPRRLCHDTVYQRKLVIIINNIIMNDNSNKIHTWATLKSILSTKLVTTQTQLNDIQSQIPLTLF